MAGGGPGGPGRGGIMVESVTAQRLRFPSLVPRSTPVLHTDRLAPGPLGEECYSCTFLMSSRE